MLDILKWLFRLAFLKAYLDLKDILFPKIKKETFKEVK